MDFLGDPEIGHGVVERRFDVKGDDGSCPGSCGPRTRPPARGRSCCWATAAPPTSGRRTSCRWPAASSVTAATRWPPSTDRATATGRSAAADDGARAAASPVVHDPVAAAADRMTADWARTLASCARSTRSATDRSATGGCRWARCSARRSWRPRPTCGARCSGSWERSRTRSLDHRGAGDHLSGAVPRADRRRARARRQGIACSGHRRHGQALHAHPGPHASVPPEEIEPSERSSPPTSAEPPLLPKMQNCYYGLPKLRVLTRFGRNSRLPNSNLGAERCCFASWALRP